MKYTLQELRKISLPKTETNEYDLNDDLKGVEDILSVTSCKVKESINMLSFDVFELKLSIDCKLNVACSVTGQEIPLDIKTDTCLYYTTDKESAIESGFIYVEGNTIDTKEEIISEILIQKPMSSKLDGIEFEDEQEVEEKINPAFASLKDYFKK